ncbi:helix-turn-helix domain-containing protein [Bacillus sp. CRN 9]|nr:helix-turn-helix domain-containing protein [Bacillus sp. CRN 9]
MIGGKLKTLRTKRGFSINELARKAKVSKSYISYIERGLQKNPSLDIITKLANSLEIPVEDFLVQKEWILDEDWQLLIKQAVLNGITKEEFTQFLIGRKHSK